MAYLTLAELYPNLADLHVNRAFHEPYCGGAHQGRTLNRWSQFWNHLGARSAGRGCSCVVCGEAYTRKYRKVENKKYNLCTACLKSYLVHQRRIS